MLQEAFLNGILFLYQQAAGAVAESRALYPDTYAHVPAPPSACQLGDLE